VVTIVHWDVAPEKPRAEPVDPLCDPVSPSPSLRSGGIPLQFDKERGVPAIARPITQNQIVTDPAFFHSSAALHKLTSAVNRHRQDLRVPVRFNLVINGDAAWPWEPDVGTQFLGQAFQFLVRHQDNLGLPKLNEVDDVPAAGCPRGLEFCVGLFGRAEHTSSRPEQVKLVAEIK
jgi:hypothetical protein